MQIKKYLPKSFLHRMLFIITVPMIISQIISSVFFYKRHWDSLEDKMLDTLVSEIAFINLLYKNDSLKSKNILKKHSSIVINVVNKHITLTDNIEQTDLKDVLIKLRNKLKNKLRQKIQVSFSPHNKHVVVDVSHKNDDLIFIFSRKKIYSATTSIYTLWTLGSSILLLIITIIFAKNQIRSITNLSVVADKIGKGRTDIEFKPQGAKEIKSAWYALELMHNRIEQQIKQRTELLAGVSHDLKTPITRMKLRLELMDIKEKKQLSQDLEQLETIIREYLEFASGDNKFKTRLENISQILEEIIHSFESDKNNIASKIPQKVFLNISKSQMTRALNNFIENALKYSTKSEVILKDNSKSVVIEIHDNGPGISKGERSKVLEPFYRIESSRNKDSGGIGLGLSISNDIISRHGGSLKLSSSYLGGLLVEVTLHK